MLFVENNPDDFFLAPQVKNSEIRLYINKDKADLHAYPLQFKLSRGASSNPVSGSVQDFSESVEYQVTSENGEFQKTYRVIATDERVTFIPFTFDFENYKIDEQYKYTLFYDREGSKELETWSSGNAGFVFSISPITKKQPELYPMQFTDDARTGNHATLLITKSTGTFGAGAKKPIAAGNIFLGAFDSGNVLGDPLKSTHFGLPIAKKPISFEGYYKYKAGAQVIDQNGKPVSVVDSCSIVAVIFDADALLARTGLAHLDGTNMLTDPSILATAVLYESSTTMPPVFQKFVLPFDYKNEPQQEDFEKGRYKIALVMSASKNGDRFMGAIGSVLIVDDLKINVQ